MPGRLISDPIIALEDAVENEPHRLNDGLRLWSDELIHSKLMARSFVYKELGNYIVRALENENARRLLVELQSEYWAVLEEINARLRAWQGTVAARDRSIAELEVKCLMCDERIAELEQLLLASALQEQVNQDSKDTEEE